MKSGSKIWSTVVDYFLILGAIIGVGFASGKEIYVFFFSFGQASLMGLIAFALLYFYLFLVIQYINHKLEIKSYNEFNAKMFGKLRKFTNIILIVNFSITSAGMLAGADYLFETFLGVGYKIPSLVLSVVTFFVLLGGIGKIKMIANWIIPIMLAVIVINSLKNITPSNVHFPIVEKSGTMAIYYALLFGVNNFVAALPVLFQTKMKAKGKLAVILTICVVILLNILILASNNFKTEMPVFELSANVSDVFYYIYFATLVFALFSTLMICSFNTQEILTKKRSVFASLMIVIINLILSNFGYGFIVKYLYVLSGVISGIYVVSLIILIAINLIKYDKKIKTKKRNNTKENVKEILETMKK